MVSWHPLPSARITLDWRLKHSKMSRNTKVQNQLRDQFIDFTQTTSNIATQFLRASNWDLELAINDFLSHSSGYGRNNSESSSLVSIFDKYKEDTNRIGIDGTLQYIEDLGYDPEHKATLALAYFLESPTLGVFERKTFLRKWHSVQVHDLKGMKAYMKSIDAQLNGNLDYLKDVYRFAFTFLLEEGQRALPLETAAEYWRLLLSDIYGDKIETWISFYEKQSKATVSKDVWNMFFVFLQDWDKDSKLENYDEAAAWPSLIDEFVEDFRESINH